MRFSTLWPALALIPLVSCSNDPNLAMTGDEFYRAYISDPIPAGVRNIQGVGFGWQGMSVYIRFEAPKEVIEYFSNLGQEIRYDDILEKEFKLPEGRSWNVFKPRWEPKKVKAPLFRTIAMSEIPHKRRNNWYLIDRENGVVYVYAEGT